jgi:hypothetical protein
LGRKAAFFQRRRNYWRLFGVRRFHPSSAFAAANRALRFEPAHGAGFAAAFRRDRMILCPLLSAIAGKGVSY